ncbi:MAG TPA: DUF2007 domain-containing protein [Syntrophales bacterium]|nr:DUF2007 domain-containing protein [Syntrophales bacterium]HPX12557.1 DUF2007 domain-containing protein [Syntrophales bacterium]HQN77873.1 DUF2007 domain-containing protein [Syntrophales bacterium]HQQ27040.1 DUF2007 domain-containing protein [Syntrophales bacterium]
MEDETWEVVHFAQGMVKARIVSGRLESEGIPVKLRYEAVGTIYGLTLDGLGEVKVLVPAEEASRARDVLSRSYDEEELEWTEEKADR